MTGEAEAAGDVLTGGIVASAVEGAAKAGKNGEFATTGTCRNCGAAVSGAYCAACGQPVRIHRSLISLGHDILHGVFHFEGKIWRTIPELFFHPGRLTRRYIDGERAKFVSPMALFLFTVFLMFAVFSFTGGALLSGEDVNIGEGADGVVSNWKAGNASAIEATEMRMEQLRKERDEPGITPEKRQKLEKEISDLEAARAWSWRPRQG